MKKSYLVLIMFIICFFAISTVSAEEQNNQTNIEDSHDSYLISDCESEHDISSNAEEILEKSGDGTFSELQVNITSASEGSTITLEKNHVYNQGVPVRG